MPSCNWVEAWNSAFSLFSFLPPYCHPNVTLKTPTPRTFCSGCDITEAQRGEVHVDALHNLKWNSLVQSSNILSLHINYLLAGYALFLQRTGSISAADWVPFPVL